MGAACPPRPVPGPVRAAGRLLRRREHDPLPGAHPRPVRRDSGGPSRAGARRAPADRGAEPGFLAQPGIGRVVGRMARAAASAPDAASQSGVRAAGTRLCTGPRRTGRGQHAERPDGRGHRCGQQPGAGPATAMAFGRAHAAAVVAAPRRDDRDLATGIARIAHGSSGSFVDPAGSRRERLSRAGTEDRTRMIMADIMISSIPHGGHEAQLLGLASELVRRGHTVTFVTTPRRAGQVRALGADALEYHSPLTGDDPSADREEDLSAVLPRLLREAKAVLPVMEHEWSGRLPECVLVDVLAWGGT